MPVYVIDTLKPKNGLDFPVVEAVDVAVEGYSSLADAVSHFATDTAIAAIIATLNTKADTSALETATANLQGQIDQIIISASAESVVAPEVAAARVGAAGTSYTTLKERLDAEYTTQSDSISAIVVNANDIERGSWSKAKKVNESLRLRTKTAFYVNKGDRIRFDSATLYFDVVIYQNAPSEDQQESIADSGWRNTEYLFTTAGYACITYANGSSYSESTTIYVSDYDANTEIIKDVYGISDINDSISAANVEVSEMKNVTYQNSKNLIPSNSTEVVPCYFPSGTPITMSTADGLALGVSNTNLRLYDQNRNFITDYNFTSSASKRTITPPVDVYYIAWNKAIDRNLQVEVGSTATDYTPYFKNAIGSVYDLYNNIENLQNIIAKKMSDYPVEIGTIGSNGYNETNNKRIRTAGYLAINGKCSVFSLTGNNIFVNTYNEDKSYINGSTWLSNITIDDENAKYIRIGSRKPDNSVIEEEEVEEIAATVRIDRPLSEGAFTDISTEETLGDNVKKIALNAIRKRNSTNYPTFALLHFSDLHGKVDRLKTIIDFYTKNKQRYNIQDALLTGDIVYQKYSNGMTWFDDVEGSEDILLAVGNHDATEGTTDYETSDHSQADLWNQYFDTRISNWNVENTSGNTYYYKDYSDNGIRLIVINSMLSGEDMTAQTTWLESVLADALTENLAVVIGCHYRSNDLAKKNCNFTDYNKVLTNYSKNALPTAMLAAVQNFIDNSGVFVCYLCGHMHDDVICYNTDYPDQLFVAVVDAYGWQNYDSDLDRAHDPDAFNLFFVDRTNHCFKLIRIGANCDTYLRLRNSITIDYNSKVVISEN